jgi:hypothetical protein
MSSPCLAIASTTLIDRPGQLRIPVEEGPHSTLQMSVNLLAGNTLRASRDAATDNHSHSIIEHVLLNGFTSL